MMALVRICGTHWHAVERDLMTLNWLWAEDNQQFVHAITGMSLGFWRVASVVLSSPPGTAVYHAETRGNTPWSPEAQLLANLSEQFGGQLNLASRYQRAGVDSTPAPAPVKFNSFAGLPDYGGIKLEAMPPDELRSRREELAKAAREGKSVDRIIRDVYRDGRAPEMVG